MQPSRAIETCYSDIGQSLLAQVSHLRDECDEITEQWAALGMHGGQRDDHAAALLMRLEPHLRDIAAFAERCREQIVAMHSNPFGR